MTTSAVPGSAPLIPTGFDPVPLSPYLPKPVFESLTPRCKVNIDGYEYIPKNYRFTLNAHGAGDTASFVLPIAKYPDWTVTIQRSEEAGNANVPVLVQILADENNAGSFKKRFYGVVDYYECDFDNDETTFYCRSLAAPLLSNKLTTPFPDQASTTTVAFILEQAQRFGLQASIALPSNQQPGLMIDVLGSEFVTGVRNWVIWNLMLQCAQYDDVDLWVDKDGVLHYENPSAIQRPEIQYVWGSNIKSMLGRHSPQFSKNISVEVRSWLPRTRTTSVSRTATQPGGGTTTTSYSKTLTANPVFGTTTVTTTSVGPNGQVTVSTGTSSGGGASSGATGYATDSGKERYVFYVANKTPQQCDDLAQKIWRQISMHEFAVRLVVPVTTAALATMDVTASLIIFNSTMAGFNGEYWPRQITESFDPQRGWDWTIDAVNHENPSGSASV